MTQFEGKFTNFQNDNLDEFYTAIGIPWVARKMMTATYPTMEITKADETWTIKLSTIMSSSANTFQLGKEYEETMMGGRTIKNVTTIEDNKMITASESDRGKSTRVMEFNDAGFLMILSHEKTELIAKRHFKKA